LITQAVRWPLLDNYLRGSKLRVSRSVPLEALKCLIICLLGFIAVETVLTDELDLLSTRTRSVKSKAAKTKGKRKTRKEIQKAKYSFVESSKRTAAYADYFNMDVEVERRMMGLSEAVSISHCRWSSFIFLICLYTGCST
jgi:hypothetical protein